MLDVPRTYPSRCTTRLGGGSSGFGSVMVDGGSLVTVGVGVGGSVVGGVTVGGSVTTAGVGGGSLAAITASASCLRYCAAMKAYASAGASISVQSPLVPISLTASPCFRIPSTLYSSP